MAVLHQATLSPTKRELIADYLNGSGGSGDVELLAAYRFDDPAGEVGIEGHLVTFGGTVRHVPLTYRGARLPDDGDLLVCTMAHSVLGERFVYPAWADPVAVDCYQRALRSELAQSALEVRKADGTSEQLEPTAVLRLDGEAGDSTELRFTTELDAPVDGTARLIARWNGGELVVAALA